MKIYLTSNGLLAIDDKVISDLVVFQNISPNEFNIITPQGNSVLPLGKNTAKFSEILIQKENGTNYTNSDDVYNGIADYFEGTNSVTSDIRSDTVTRESGSWTIPFSTSLDGLNYNLHVCITQDGFDIYNNYMTPGSPTGFDVVIPVGGTATIVYTATKHK